MSLKCMIDKWLHKGQISQEEYDAVIKKLDGHDAELIKAKDKVIEQYKWESDVAISQLEDIGASFGLNMKLWLAEHDKQIEEKAYQQGRADAIDSELMNDVYMRRTKLVYQEGINKGIADGAREFAEWLLHHSMLCDSLGQDLNDNDLLSESEIIDEVLSEWQKEQKK